MDSRTFERITLTDGTRFILRITGESDRFLRGTEVDTEGDEIVPRGKDADGNAFTERTRFIEKKLIRRRVVLAFNRTYGILEPEKR